MPVNYHEYSLSIKGRKNTQKWWIKEKHGLCLIWTKLHLVHCVWHRNIRLDLRSRLILLRHTQFTRYSLSISDTHHVFLLYFAVSFKQSLSGVLKKLVSNESSELNIFHKTLVFTYFNLFILTYETLLSTVQSLPHLRTFMLHA